MWPLYPGWMNCVQTTKIYIFICVRDCRVIYFVCKQRDGETPLSNINEYWYLKLKL